MGTFKDQYKAGVNQKFKHNHFNITWNNFIIYELAWNVFIDVK